ncbi:hypothetical protein H5410_003126, partial [Solanum commersonii]
DNAQKIVGYLSSHSRVKAIYASLLDHPGRSLHFSHIFKQAMGAISVLSLLAVIAPLFKHVSKASSLQSVLKPYSIEDESHASIKTMLKIAKMSHAHGALVLVDYNIISRVLLAFGAQSSLIVHCLVDIVVNSTTKFISGYSDLMASVLSVRGKTWRRMCTSYKMLKVQGEWTKNYSILMFPSMSEECHLCRCFCPSWRSLHFSQ